MKNTTIMSAMLATVLCMSLGACASDPVATTTEPSTHALKAGDTFTYHHRQTDENGTLIEGSDTAAIARVLQNDVAFQGRSNVVVTVYNGDTTHLAFDGDSLIQQWQDGVPIMNGISIPPIWTPLPLRSGSKSLLDSTVTTVIAGMSATIRMYIESTFLGSDTVVINGVAHPSLRTVKTVGVDVVVSGQTYSTIVESIYSFAPSIGYFTAMQTRYDSNSNFSPIPNSTATDELTGFSIHE